MSIVNRFTLLLLTIFFLNSCEEKVSENDLIQYKSIMDVRLGHLGNAMIIKGRLLDAYNLRNESSDEDHFKEAEELVKGHLNSFGAPDDLKKLKIPNSKKLKEVHSTLIEASELLISGVNALEDNAWLGGSVSFAERNLEIARVNFQNAVKIVYKIEDEKKVKPVMEHNEYDVGEKPDASDMLNNDSEN